MAVYANADLGQLPSQVQRAVIIVHGVKRNAVDYFAIGQHLLAMAHLTPANTLLLAPNFMAHKDLGLLPDMPIWGGRCLDAGRSVDPGGDRHHQLPGAG